MKYFLTGISGFIGSNLARELATDGHTVNALIRGTASSELGDMNGINLIRGGLFDKDILRQAMEGCDAAFHLAAYAKPWAKDPGEYHRINVEGADSIFDAALQVGVKRVVFTSSAATMSPSYDTEAVTESTPRKVPYFNAYEVTKADAEKLAVEYCHKGLEVVTVNPSRVFGPGPLNPSNSVTKMIVGFCQGSWRIIPGDGTKIGNYVFIDDVVHGHLLAAQKGRPGERYILGGDNITFDRFFEILAEVSGERHRMFHLPLGIMKAAARMMELQNPVTGIPPAITVDFVKKYLNHWSLSSEKATQELGYRITPFDVGVRKTIAWMGAK
jgi:nucleoside-diphosphate-sugar epimerase